MNILFRVPSNGYDSFGRKKSVVFRGTLIKATRGQSLNPFFKKDASASGRVMRPDASLCDFDAIFFSRKALPLLNDATDATDATFYASIRIM